MNAIYTIRHYTLLMIKITHIFKLYMGIKGSRAWCHGFNTTIDQRLLASKPKLVGNLFFPLIVSFGTL